MRTQRGCALVSVVEIEHEVLLGLRRGGSILPVLHSLHRVLDEDRISTPYDNVRHSPVRKYNQGKPDQPFNMQVLQGRGICGLDLEYHFAIRLTGFLAQRCGSETGREAKH
jgi:hypothetical protein